MKKTNFFAIILFLFAMNFTYAQLKSVTTCEDFCMIYKYLENNNADDEREATKKLGYDYNSFVEYGFNHPELFKDCKCIESGKKNTYELCDYEWSYNNSNPSLNKGWVNVTIDKIDIINKKTGEARVYFSFENTTSLFFQLDLSNLHIAQNGVGHNPPTTCDFILFPKEKKQYYQPIRLITDCSKNNNDGVYNFQFNFSRGELTGIALQDFITRITSANFLPIPFSQTLAFYGLNVGFSNEAAKLNILNILWTAATGDWLSRDLFENATSGLNGLLDVGLENKCDAKLFLLRLKPDIIKSIYQQDIDPLTFLSAVFKLCDCILTNPTTSKLVIDKIKDIFPGLATSSLKEFAANFGNLVAGYWRVFSLIPITKDVWDTQQIVTDYTSIDIKLKCCEKIY